MDIILQTARLTLRRFTAADEDLLVDLDSDPEVMRYLTGGRPTSRAEARDHVLPRVMAVYDRHPGFGTFATLDRSSGDFLGWHSLRPPYDAGFKGVELGYRLKRSAWGRGIASEGARALVDYGFGAMGVQRIFAKTMSVNLGSRAVMRKVGLAYVRTFHELFDDPIPGVEEGEVEYAITRAAWSAAR